MDAVLGEIKKGVEGMISSQSSMEAKFMDLDKDVKGTGEVVKLLDGRVQVLEEYLRERKTVGVSLPGLEDELKTKKFSLAKAMIVAGLTATGQHPEHNKALGFELEVMQQSTQKAMDTGTAGAGGGYVIPQEYLATLIELLRAKLVVMQAGATMMEGLSGSPVIIPKQLTGSTVYWIGQNATITASDPSFGQIQMTPKTMAIRSQYSNLLGILSNPGIEAIIRRDFAKVAALELDRVALRGSGSSNQPLGVNGVSGLGSYVIGSGNGGDLTRQDALKLVGVLEDANALDGKLGFITNPKAKRVLKNERIAQFSGQTLGAYTIYPLSDAQLNEMLGYPMLTTTQVPANLTTGSSSDCTEVYFGNWEELMIGMWGSLELLATNIGGNAWAQNAIELRLIQNVDVQVRHGASFALSNSARTNNA